MIRTPFSDGPHTSSLAIIAEAPSYAEISEGRPLVGPSGGIYEQCLHSAGIARRTIYTGNVSRGQIKDGKELLIPGRNTAKGWVPSKWTQKGEAERELFYDRARELDANVFVPMGNIALKALAGVDGISKYRGSILPCTVHGLKDRKVIPTYHPAATLRGKSVWKNDIIVDLLRCQRERGSQSIPPAHGELLWDPNFDEVLSYLDACEAAGKFAHDIEVYNHQISCMSFSIDAWTGICIPFHDGRKKGRHRWTPEQEVQIWKRIAEVLEGGHEVIGQNYIFDMSVLLLRNGILPRGLIQDSMVAHSIMYPDLPKGLDYLCSIYTNVPYYKDDRKLWNKLDDSEDAQQRFWQYSARDAVATLQAWNEIERDLLEDPLYTRTYLRTMSLYDPLLFLQQKGIPVDINARADANKQLEIDIAAKLKELHEKADYEFNPSSSQQCAKYFYEHKGIKPYKNDGSITTDDVALTRLRKTHGLEEAGLVQSYRNLSKLYSNAMTARLDPDNHFRCSMNPRGTYGGRLSSSETIFETGGNMQNLDLRFKKFLRPPPGYAFFEFDKAGSEWVIMAHLTRDPMMLQVVQGDVSPHVVTAYLSTKIPMSLIVVEDKAIGHLTSPEDIRRAREEHVPEILEYGELLPRNMTVRQAYKRANHGLNYDFGYKQFALKYDLLERDSKRIYDLYHRAYPGIQDWHRDGIRRQLKKDRTLINCFGRKLRLLGNLNDDLYRKGYAFPAQSTNVDMINDAMVSIWNAPECQPFELLMQVHDSLLYQVKLPPANGLSWARLALLVERIAHRYMTPELEYHGEKFTVKTDLKVSTESWADMEEVNIHLGLEATEIHLRESLN